MTIQRRTLLQLAGGSCLAPWTAHTAQAADWPSQPVKLIVPAPPGGPVDKMARFMAQEMNQRLKGNFIVDNRPGGAGFTAAMAVAKAAPDGHTLHVTSTLNAIGQTLFPNPPVDINNDFVHIGGLSQGPQILVARTDFPADSLRKLIEMARKEPGKLNYASSGAGSTGHLTIELFLKQAGIQMAHVGYKGAAPAMQDTLAGIVPVLVITPPVALPHIKAGKLRVLASTGARRSSFMPDVPTFEELGVSGLTTNAWGGVSAPRGTPAEIVRRLHAALLEMNRSAPTIANYAADGFEPFSPASPEEFARIVRDDTERYGRIIKSANIQPS